MAKFKRILLKLSGESLMGKQSFGIDPERLSDYAKQIKEVHEMGVQIGIVIGGGNIFRGLSGSQKGFDRVKGDQMGMCATVINSLALSSALGALGVKNKVLTAIRMEPIGEFYTKWKAIEAMEEGYICIFSAGTGSPYFTTDTGSSLRGIEIEADVMLKGTRVDGIYTIHTCTLQHHVCLYFNTTQRRTGISSKVRATSTSREDTNITLLHSLNSLPLGIELTDWFHTDSRKHFVLYAQSSKRTTQGKRVDDRSTHTHLVTFDTVETLLASTQSTEDITTTNDDTYLNSHFMYFLDLFCIITKTLRINAETLFTHQAFTAQFQKDSFKLSHVLYELKLIIYVFPTILRVALFPDNTDFAKSIRTDSSLSIMQNQMAIILNFNQGAFKFTICIPIRMEAFSAIQRQMIDSRHVHIVCTAQQFIILFESIKDFLQDFITIHLMPKNLS